MMGKSKNDKKDGTTKQTGAESPVTRSRREKLGKSSNSGTSSRVATSEFQEKTKDEIV